MAGKLGPVTTNGEGMLVAAPERWDEACFAVPALRAILASGLRTGILCPAEQKAFWSTVEGLAVFGFTARSRAAAVAAEISGNWEAALSWQAGFAAEVFKAAGIPKRLGVEERRFRKLLTHRLECTVGPLEHRVRHYLAAVEELGIGTERAEFFTPAERVEERVAGSVLLGPESDFGPNHEWRIERWQEVGMALVEAGHRVSVISVRPGPSPAKTLAGKLGGEVELLQVATLGEAFSKLASYEWVVAADGSLPHLAAHAGATCITLFGPNDPAWKRPLGRRHAVVRQHVECAPCLLAKCPLDLRCQIEMETARVLRAVSKKLSEA
ncbi:MAG: glycosyltransferase family 9 protein [Luteolibacter sp.]